jgi:tetratricopeptide (TPR) repeat protein
MVVITQPDWCPGCIELDRKLLRNPDADEVASLTREWLVLEMMGYDEPDASVIAAHGLGFLGTPTTLLLSPRAGQRRLGEARQVAAIVGFPDDYLEQLRRAAAGFDAISEAQAQLREHNDVTSLQALARAYLAAGDAEAARRVFHSLLLRPELAAAERQALALQAILQPTQRIENDHRRALAELADWVEAYPDGRHDLDYVYGRAFALLSLGEIEAARAWIAAQYLGSDDADTVASYLYLAFRDPTGQLLADAEPRAAQAIREFPEQAARFHAAHGRLLRRQGRLAEAEQAFATAVELAGEAHPSHGTYLGQLEFVRQERIAAAD